MGRNILAHGAAVLAGKREEHLSSPVQYQRPGVGGVTILAAVGRSEFEEIEEGGPIRRTQTRDFIVTAAALVISGQRIEPRIGDQIHEREDGQTVVYEVSSIGGEQPFRRSDSFGKSLRIHTRRIQALVG